VSRIRHFFLTHRALSLAIVTLALAIKALVPSGMMLEARGDLLLTVTICSGMGAVETKTISIERDSSPSDGDEQGSSADTSLCGFSSLGQAALGGTDPLVLAIALLFILALGFAPRYIITARAASFRWPPMRGPPLSA
jgi:hypothetical protein